MVMSVASVTFLPLQPLPLTLIFPATLPAGVMPVCYGDTFTSASNFKSMLLLISLFSPNLLFGL